MSGRDMDIFIVIISITLPLSYVYILGVGSAYYKGSTLEAFSFVSVFCPHKFETAGKKYYSALVGWYIVMALSIGVIYVLP